MKTLKIFHLCFLGIICWCFLFWVKLPKHYEPSIELQQKSEPQKFGNGTLAVIAIFRNEAPYLLEWIAHHMHIGVDMFFLYNHGSTDDYYEVLYPLIEKGTVVLTNVSKIFSGTPEEIGDALNHKLVSQIGSIQHWFRVMSTTFQWVLSIDIDEFVYLDEENNKNGLKTLLKRKTFTDAGGVALFRIHFSTNGKEKLLKRNELQTMTFFERKRSHKAATREYPKIIFRAAARTEPFLNLHSYNGTVGFLYNAAGQRNGTVDSFCSDCSVPRVEKPVVILHYLARSLESCNLKKELSRALHGGWRHRMDNTYCLKMHKKSSLFQDTVYVRDKNLITRMTNSHKRLCASMYTLNSKYCNKHKCCSAYGWTQTR